MSKKKKELKRLKKDNKQLMAMFQDCLEVLRNVEYNSDRVSKDVLETILYSTRPKNYGEKARFKAEAGGSITVNYIGGKDGIGVAHMSGKPDSQHFMFDNPDDFDLGDTGEEDYADGFDDFDYSGTDDTDEEDYDTENMLRELFGREPDEEDDFEDDGDSYRCKCQPNCNKNMHKVDLDRLLKLYHQQVLHEFNETDETLRYRDEDEEEHTCHCGGNCNCKEEESNLGDALLRAVVTAFLKADPSVEVAEDNKKPTTKEVVKPAVKADNEPAVKADNEPAVKADNKSVTKQPVKKAPKKANKDKYGRVDEGEEIRLNCPRQNKFDTNLCNGCPEYDVCHDIAEEDNNREFVCPRDKRFDSKLCWDCPQFDACYEEAEARTQQEEEDARARAENEEDEADFDDIFKNL